MNFIYILLGLEVLVTLAVSIFFVKKIYHQSQETPTSQKDFDDRLNHLEE